MKKRKLIGLITASPEFDYPQRVLDGVFSQCEKYGYDVAVFAPLTQVCNPYKEYLKGELNIFELINYDLLDGIILTPITLTVAGVQGVMDYLLEKIEAECKVPVVSLDLPSGDFETIRTDDRQSFFNITEHIIKKHNRRNIYMLTGIKGTEIAEMRLNGYKDAVTKYGIGVKEENIFYGDFWFNSGERLAEDIIAHRVPMPEAIICANDHMAIGLTNRLLAGGIKIPEDVIVTGHDATQDSCINIPTVTSYIPEVRHCAAEAVNYLHKLISPDEPEFPVDYDGTEKSLCIGSTCGCEEDIEYTKSRLTNSIYHSNKNYGENLLDNIDISFLLESYVSEIFTGATSPEDLLRKIYESTYLIQPYERFYLCLTEDWLNTGTVRTSGYPDKMKIAIRSITNYLPGNDLNGDLDENTLFDTSVMFPRIHHYHEVPRAFYFTPVHFKDSLLGYGVLECNLSQTKKIGNVYRNWIRNINNGLEMIRVQNTISEFSRHDAMTGLYNRRGMDIAINDFRSRATNEDSWLVFVVDMDGLKYINDHYGHNEGDFGIKTVATALSSTVKGTQVCIRSGGDEFYIIGMDNYDEEYAKSFIADFNTCLEKLSKASGKEYPISASIGYSLKPVKSDYSIDEILKLADTDMYNNKSEKKKNRK